MEQRAKLTVMKGVMSKPSKEEFVQGMEQSSKSAITNSVPTCPGGREDCVEGMERGSKFSMFSILKTQFMCGATSPIATQESPWNNTICMLSCP